MTLIIILIILFIFSLLVNYFLFKSVKKKNGIIERQNEVIGKASQNMKHLVDYNDVIQNISKNHQEVYNKIKEAKTDEEVNNIIHNLININNNHVHDD